MNENVVNINLKSFTRDNKILTGRPNGEAAWHLLANQDSNLSSLSDATKVKLVGDGSAIISNSYFLGMLSPIFRAYSSKQSLIEHLDFTELNQHNKMELLLGIERGYPKITNPFM